MDKIITKMKSSGYHVKLLPQTCSYCNKKAKYELETGLWFLTTRPICENHRQELVKQIDKGE